MRIIDLALKDLRQVLRDRQSLVFMLVMPMIFTVFFGFMFRNQNEQADERLVIGVVNRDPRGVLSDALIDLLNRSETVRVEVIEEASEGSLDSRIVKDELAAGLVIPTNFSRATLNDENLQMEIIINEETPEGQTARRGLQTAITRILGMAQAARSSLAAYEIQAGMLDGDSRAAYLEEAVIRAAEAWQTAPLSVKVSSKVTDEQAALVDQVVEANPYNQYSPGMMVMFALFGVMQAAMVMVIERHTGAMARLLTTPMRKGELISGHILGMFIIFFVQQLLLVLFGQLILKVDYFRVPLALLLVMFALALWVASLGLLISALVKKEEQVVLYSMIAMFLFSALGGAWFSLEMVGGAFYTIGHLTPAAWAIDGFQNLVIRGLGLRAVLLPVGILLAYTAAFFGLAIWRFKFE